MEKSFRRKIINTVLILILVLIWGHIGLGVKQIISNNQDSNRLNLIETHAPKLAAANPFIYPDTQRDLFVKARKAQPPPVIEKNPRLIPMRRRNTNNLKLLGIFGGPERPLAIVHNGKNIQYVSTGDTLEAGKIIAIDGDSLVIAQTEATKIILHLKI